jgi:hypothetical protein
MAAFIDGEGSILINTQKAKKVTRGWYLRVTVANTDIRLLMWCKERFGGAVREANAAKYYGEHKNYKNAYHWSLGGYPGAWVLRNCLPFFVLKREQAEIGIALQESIGPRSQGRKKVLSDETIEHRRNLKKRLLVLKARGKTLMPEQAERIQEVS